MAKKSKDIPSETLLPVLFVEQPVPVPWWAAVTHSTGSTGNIIFLFSNHSNFTAKVLLMYQSQYPNYANSSTPHTSYISFHHTSLLLRESQLLPWSVFSHDGSFSLLLFLLLLGWHSWFVFHFQFFTFHPLFPFSHGVMSITNQYLDLGCCQRRSLNQRQIRAIHKSNLNRFLLQFVSLSIVHCDNLKGKGIKHPGCREAQSGP